MQEKLKENSRLKSTTSKHRDGPRPIYERKNDIGKDGRISEKQID